MSKGYDEKCYELAQYFLEDYEHSEAQAAELAQDIQDAVENWFGGAGQLKEKA